MNHERSGHHPPRPLVRPPALRPGDVVGVWSPSAGLAHDFPHRLERGVAWLERQGFRVRVAPHATGRRGWVSGTAEERVADLHALLADPAVRGIFATIGGDHSCQLLPLIEWERLRARPVVFAGMSDVTVLNIAIHVETGLVTFNGPSVMDALGEYPDVLPYTAEHLLRAVTRPEPLGALRPAEAWTDEFLDWSTQADLTRARRLQPSSGWAWLTSGRGPVRGRLLGGCLESLEHLRGTRWWPDWSGAVLFLETSEERPSPARVDALLSDYDNMGVLEQVAALVVARPYGYDDAARVELHALLRERGERYGIPVVADLDAGHTHPVLTLPLGCLVEVDPAAQRVAVLEAAVVPHDG